MGIVGKTARILDTRENTPTRRLSGEEITRCIPEVLKRSPLSRVKNALKAVKMFKTLRVEKSHPAEASWILRRGWDSNVMERPSGFPENPWVLHCPTTHHLYLSKSCQKTPPAGQWYHYQHDQEPKAESCIAVEIMAGNRVRVIDTRAYTNDHRLSGEESKLIPNPEDTSERWARMKTDVLKAVRIYSSAAHLSGEVESDSPLESQDTVSELVNLTSAAIQCDAPSGETTEAPGLEISPPKSIQLVHRPTTIALKVSFAQIRLGSETTKVSYAQVCRKRVVARKQMALRTRPKRTHSAWRRDNQRLLAPKSRRAVAPATPGPGSYDSAPWGVHWNNVHKTKRLKVKSVKGGFGSRSKRFDPKPNFLRI